MMTKPLLAILLLLPSSVSAGELDGKSLMCFNYFAERFAYGFGFIEGGVEIERVTGIV